MAPVRYQNCWKNPEAAANGPRPILKLLKERKGRCQLPPSDIKIAERAQRPLPMAPSNIKIMNKLKSRCQWALSDIKIAERVTRAAASGPCPILKSLKEPKGRCQWALSGIKIAERT